MNNTTSLTKLHHKLVAVTEERDRLAAELQKLRDQMEVKWRPVVGFEGLYEVSSNGDIRNVQTGNIAAKSLMGDGYVKADLWKKGKRKQTSAHRVVAEAFIGGIDGLEINHRNGVKTDNRVSNLEITTRSGNVNHSYYELGHIIKPILATNIATGDTTEYRSIEEAVRLGGFRSSSIYDCLNGKVKTHSGHSFSRPTAPVAAPAVQLEDGSDDYYEHLGALVEQHPVGVMHHNTDKQVPDEPAQSVPEEWRKVMTRLLDTFERCEAGFHPHVEIRLAVRDEARALLQSAEGYSSQAQNEVRHD